jgi:multidrug efflux pump subunit AcrA (membrane-fusion protein)
VNAKAVYLDGVRRLVFVRNGPSTFTRRPVRIGSESDGRLPVLSGLKPGDEVVVAGNLFLQQLVVSARPVDAEGRKP